LDRPEHLRAITALERARGSSGWGVPLAVIAEFWRLATRPLAGTQASTADQARSFVEDLTRAGGALWQPRAAFAHRLLALASERDCMGTEIADLQIALTARDNGATEIWTHDRKFPSLRGLRVVDPL